MVEASIFASSALVWVVRLPVILFAITIHEYAHGKAAYRLGDPTAKMHGRLTFNPFSHLDPLGALCFLLVGFGWAKPVPVDPRYFRNPRRDNMLVSLAGPLSNLATAFAAGLLLRLLPIPGEQYLMVLSQMVILNVAFAIFNLLPIHPLDGSHVLEGLLPLRQAITFRSWARYGPMILLGVILLDSVGRVGILRVLIGYPVWHLSFLFGGQSVFWGLRLLSMLG